MWPDLRQHPDAFGETWRDVGKFWALPGGDTRHFPEHSFGTIARTTLSSSPGRPSCLFVMPAAQERTYPKVAEALLATRPGKMPPGDPGEHKSCHWVAERLSQRCPTIAPATEIQPNFNHVRPMWTVLGHPWAEFGQPWANIFSATLGLSGWSPRRNRRAPMLTPSCDQVAVELPDAPQRVCCGSRETANIRPLRSGQRLAEFGQARSRRQGLHNLGHC